MPSYTNQWIGFYNKSIDRFLYDKKIGLTPLSLDPIINYIFKESPFDSTQKNEVFQ